MIRYIGALVIVIPILILFWQKSNIVDSLQCGTCQISKFYRFIDIVKDGEPLMVGDPTRSEKMLRLFKDALNYDDD